MEAIMFSDHWYVPYSPSSDVAAGTVVVQGDLVGVAVTKIPANSLGSLAVQGVFSFKKGTGAISVGASVYWDNTNKVATTTASGNKLIGKCVRAAASGDDRVLVLMNQ